MNTYRIENSTSGAALGNYQGEDEEAAILAILADAGCTDEPAEDLIATQLDLRANPNHIPPETVNTISGQLPGVDPHHGSVRNYQTGEVLRDATAAELAVSIAVAKTDGGTGVIEIDGVNCYVEFGP